MKLSITYAELQDYVARHYHKNVNLGYVNESTPAVSFAKKLVPEKSDWIEVLADNVIRLRLGDIDKLKKAFEKVELKSICFEQEKACIGIGLL